MVVLKNVATEEVEVVSLYKNRLADSVTVTVPVTVPVGIRIDPNVFVFSRYVYEG